MTSDEDRWKARVRLTLARRGVSKDVADTALAEVDEHSTESGDEPAKAFGSPDTFAESVVRERVPAAARADVDAFGMTGAQRRSEVFARSGFVLAGAGTFAWVTAGPMVPVTAAGLCGVLLLSAAALMASFALNAMWADGRRRAVRAAWAAICAVGVLAAVAFTSLPRNVLGVFPAPVIIAVGLALLWWAFTRKDRGAAAASPAGNAAWLERLESLLIGRHLLPRSRAAELTREAESHLMATGTSPSDEFGSADEYAVRLAEHEPKQFVLMSPTVLRLVPLVALVVAMALMLLLP